MQIFMSPNRLSHMLKLVIVCSYVLTLIRLGFFGYAICYIWDVGTRSLFFGKYTLTHTHTHIHVNRGGM